MTIYRLDALQAKHDVARLPFSLKVLLENLLRTEGNGAVEAADIEALAGWDHHAEPDTEIAFTPARVVLQDFTGVPAVVDLAAMRDAMAALGGDPSKINPLVPAELVIDHSVQVDAFGTARRLPHQRRARVRAQRRSATQFLRWGQSAFDGFTVVPPDTGIVHQVNLEYLARVVFVNDDDARARWPYPDTLVGTDSHTTMVNGLGVLGWGVGGIEAEAAMLGQPMSMLIPQVARLQAPRRAARGRDGDRPRPHRHRAAAPEGRRRQVRRVLRPRRVRAAAGRPRDASATWPRSSASTCAIFPIDAETLRYLEFSGRAPEQIELVEAYARAQGLLHDEDSDGRRRSPTRSSSTSARSCRRSPARSARRTASRSRARRPSSPRR